MKILNDLFKTKKSNFSILCLSTHVKQVYCENRGDFAPDTITIKHAVISQEHAILCVIQTIDYNTDQQTYAVTTFAEEVKSLQHCDLDASHHAFQAFMFENVQLTWASLPDNVELSKLSASRIGLGNFEDLSDIYSFIEQFLQSDACQALFCSEADQEMQALYHAIAHDEEEDAYLCDGVYLRADGSLYDTKNK